MKKVLFIYSFAVSLTLFLSLYSYTYQKYWHAQVYLEHLPKRNIYPQYDLRTNEEINTSDVNMRQISDYIPLYGIFMYRLYDFVKNWGALLYLFLLVSFVIIGLYNKYDITILKANIIGIQLIVILIILQKIVY